MKVAHVTGNTDEKNTSASSTNILQVEWEKNAYVIAVISSCKRFLGKKSELPMQ
jgi:hypothetical protein